MIPAIILFVLTYVMLLVFPKYRAYIALLSAALFVILGILPIQKVFFAIDWNVLLMIGSTMGIVFLFIESKMPALLADVLISKTPNVKWAIIALSLFAGLISAFVDNVATVLMVAPIALSISKKSNVSPVPAVISIAVSSNLQGAATLVGDTTSIMLGGYAKMDFFKFFFFNGKIGIFWIVQISAIVATFVLFLTLRKFNEPIGVMEKTKVTDYFPSFLLLAMLVLLITASFIPNAPSITNGVICLTLLIIGLIREVVKTKKFDIAKNVIKDIDYFTLCLLAGLFVVIAGISEAGVIEKIAAIIVSVSGDNVFIVYTILVWASVLLSAFIDNIPYVATMLPVTADIALLMGINPILLYLGLLSGATLGGNLTPIGASANITALGILQKNGYEVKAKDFMKISVPFTLAAVTTGYILIWFIYR